jgi:hypothetical protein
MQINELVSFLENVLQKRFPNIHAKQQIEGDLDRKINFACPICGDSQKKVSKKRGNIFLDTGTYKCFNDGCMSYMPLHEFISQMCNQHGILLPSFLLDEPVQSKVRPNRENQLVRFLTSDTSELVKVTDVINRFSLKRLDQIDEGSEAYRYIDGRNITQVDDFGDCLYSDFADNKVYIFNFDRRSGRILGFSIRSLDPDADRKYIIKSYTDLKQIFAQREIAKELVDDANFLNNYFNILNVDFSKPISLTEGQFDSMFVRNCIATSGVSKAMSILKDLGVKSLIRIIFDRDSAGKNQMMSLIKQGYSVFLWNKVASDLRKKFPSDDDYYKIKGIKDINDLFSFLFERDDDYSVHEFNVWLDGYFSDSVFDLIYL